MAELHRGRDRERERQKSSTCSFIPQMAKTARAVMERRKEPELVPGLPCGFRVLSTRAYSTAFQGSLAGARSEMEQQELKLAPWMGCHCHRCSSPCYITALPLKPYFKACLLFVFRISLFYLSLSQWVVWLIFLKMRVWLGEGYGKRYLPSVDLLLKQPQQQGLVQAKVRELELHPGFPTWVTGLPTRVLTIEHPLLPSQAH